MDDLLDTSNSSAVGELPSDQPTPKLSEKQLMFVTLLHQHWDQYGVLLTAEAAFNQYGVPQKDFNRWMSKETVRNALSERGVNLKPFDLDDGDWRTKSLTPIQLLVANAMLDTVDTRSTKKKLQDYGVHTQTYASWLRDPVFREYLEQRTKDKLGDYKYEARLALMDKVSSGDVKAIELYLEMVGEYTRASARGSTNGNFDVRGIIVSIVEIIADEVDDPAISARIGDRIKSLVGAHATAEALVNPSGPVGELVSGSVVSGSVVVDNPIRPIPVAKAREMTPELEELLNSGKGVNL